MIIIGSILTTFESISTFKGSWGSWKLDWALNRTTIGKFSLFKSLKRSVSSLATSSHVNSNSIKRIIKPEFLNGKMDCKVGQAAHEPQEESFPRVVGVATFSKIKSVFVNLFANMVWSKIFACMSPLDF